MYSLSKWTFIGRLSFLFLVGLAVSSCGGGGGSSDSPPVASSDSNGEDTTPPLRPGSLYTQINAANASSYSFTFFGGEVGAYVHWIFEDENGVRIEGNRLIESNETIIEGVDLTGLRDGMVNAPYYAKDQAGNESTSIGGALVKDTVPPADYFPSSAISEINDANEASFSFSINSPEPEASLASYQYTLSDHRGSEITGEGDITGIPQVLNNIDVSPLDAGDITLSIVLVDQMDNPGSPESVVIPKVSAAQDPTISGALTYEQVPHHTFFGGLDYSDSFNAPIRGATVQLLDDADNVLEETISSEAGAYSFSVPANQLVRIRVLAQARQNGTPGWNFKVVDNTSINALYVLQGDLISSGSVNSTRNLHAPSGWEFGSYADPRAAAPFAILDAIYTATQFVLDTDDSIQFPELDIHWSELNRPVSGDRSLGEIGTSFYDPQEQGIYILGDEDNDTDEYDRSVIIHEWCHYFENRLSRTDSYGGDHSLGDSLDLRLAWSEGACNAMSAMVLNDRYYRDSLGSEQADEFSIDLEDNAISNSGWYNEESVGAVLYDIYDSNEDAADIINEGFDELLAAYLSDDFIESPAATSLYSFVNALNQVFFDQGNPSQEMLVADLTTEQNITVNDEYGSGETNNGGDSRTLPIYSQITLNGSAATACSINTFGTFNKLGNVGMVRFSIANEAQYTLTADRASGDSTTDPDIEIYREGQIIAGINSTAVNTESLTATLPIGSYIAYIYDKNNIINDTGLSACYDVSLSN